MCTKNILISIIRFRKNTDSAHWHARRAPGTCNYVTDDEAPGSPCMLWKNTIPSCPWVSPTSSYPSSQNDGSQGPCNSRACVAFVQQPARDHMLPKGNGQRVQPSQGKPAAAVRHKLGFSLICPVVLCIPLLALSLLKSAPQKHTRRLCHPRGRGAWPRTQGILPRIPSQPPAVLHNANEYPLQR